MNKFLKRCCILFFVIASANTFAGIVNISPVHLTLNKSKTIDWLTIDNPTAKTIYFQSHVKKWGQKEGESVYVPSNVIEVNPPVFKISPGQTTIVRIALRAPYHFFPMEKAYRIYFQQLPLSKGNKKEGLPQLRLLFKIGVPVFVSPQGKISKQLNWNAKIEGKKLFVTLKNDGNIHVQLNGIKFSLPDVGKTISTMQQSFDILAHNSFQWILPLPAEANKIKKIEINADMGLSNKIKLVKGLS